MEVSGAWAIGDTTMDDEWKRVHSSWKEGGCSCKTFDEHKAHIAHLKNIDERARRIAEKGGLEGFPMLLKSIEKPARSHLRLIIGGKK